MMILGLMGVPNIWASGILLHIVIEFTRYLGLLLLDVARSWVSQLETCCNHPEHLGMALKGCDFHQFSPAGWATPHHKYANADHTSQESIFTGLRENQPWLLAKL